MSGAVQQAKRRSSSGGDDNDDSVLEIGGNRLVLAVCNPTQEDILSELVRKHAGGTIPQKTKNILKPLVENRDQLISKAKALPNGAGISSKIADAIPISLPTKAYTGPQIADVLLKAHVALKLLADALPRPDRQFLGLWNPLDTAIKTAISHFQEQELDCSSQRPVVCLRSGGST